MPAAVVVRAAARLLAVALPTLGLATLIVGYLQDVVGVPNPSAVYLVAVVACAWAAGTPGAVVAALAASLTYNWFFTEPRQTFTISDPLVWLSVVTLLFVGVVVGELAAIQRDRAQTALVRERQATALFRLSRAMATRTSTATVAPEVAAILGAEAGTRRAWIAFGADDAAERVVADTGTGPRPAGGLHHILRRTPGDEPAAWVRVHRQNPPSSAGSAGSAGPGAPATGAEGDGYRVRIEAGGRPAGSIWAVRDRAAGVPDRTATRLLSAAADQLGQALALDRLAAESTAAAVARESDALKSALLQSVSHDLRTPLATIRAAAGSLRPGSGLSPDEQADSAETIEREVEYLNRLVTNLLDLSRIEGGALRPDLDAYEPEELVLPIVGRLRGRLGDRPVTVDLPADAILVDATYFESVLVNLLENAAKYTPPDAPIRILGETRPAEGWLRLTVEDGGPGVAPQHLPRLFDKFYRVPGSPRTSRSGTGIGLAVVRGLVEAMGGTVAARRGELGGLAVDLLLPLAPPIPGEDRDATG